MKTNSKLKRKIPFAHLTYQTKKGFFVSLAELDTLKQQIVDARRLKDVREMVQALMVWGDDGGAVERSPTNERKNGEKS